MRRTLRLVLNDERSGARLTPELIARLSAALGGDPTARLVVIEGREEAFCDGLDLRLVGADAAEGRGEATAAGLAGLADLLVSLRNDPRPVLALVEGRAMGGGVGLAAGADLVLASRQATFALPETLFGLVPGVVFPFISARVGVPRTLALALGGRTLSAEEACAWGLVDEVCDDVQATAREYQKRLLRQDARAQAEVKKLARHHFTLPEDYMAAAVRSFSFLLNGVAAQERIARFAAGEAPWPDEVDGDQ